MRNQVSLMALVLALLAPLPGLAQITRATKQDLAPLPSFFKPDANGEIHFSNDPIKHPPGMPKPSKNPRDLTGIYSSNAYGDEVAATDATVVPGGGPGGPGGPPGGPGPGGSRGFKVNDVSIASVRGKSFNRGTCMPALETLRSFNPGQIVMTDDAVILVGENNHDHQIIYLNSQHPAGLKPTLNGDSVGHWEGNVLVVDVAGVKGEKTDHFIERIRKLSNGAIENLVIQDDGSRQAFTTHWRPDLSLHEDSCEDFAEAYGAGYTAPAAPNLNGSVLK